METIDKIYKIKGRTTKIPFNPKIECFEEIIFKALKRRPHTLKHSYAPLKPNA